MKTVVIGDVHGCIDEFRALVGMTDRGDRIVQLGDLMDRGPSPAECVKYAREQGFEMVLGNHDEKHLRWRRHEVARRETGKSNPLRWMPPAAQEQNWLLSDEDIAWLESRPVMLDLGNWLAVHAGFEPGLPLDKQVPKKVIRVRYVVVATGRMFSLADPDEVAPEGGDTVQERTYGGRDQPPKSVWWHEVWQGKNVVFGHAVQGREAKWLGKTGSVCVGVDTGCCYGGRLTALVIGDNGPGDVSFISVPAARVYYDRNIPQALR